MYEIIEWNGIQGNSLQVQYQQVSLESIFNASANLSGLPGWDETDSEGIDIINVEFTRKVKASDREAYLFAMLSGVTAGMIDYAVVGKIDYRAIIQNVLNDPKNLSMEQVQSLLTLIAKLNGFNNEKLDQFAADIDKVFFKAEDAIRNAPKYKKIVKDFAAGMSIKAIVTSIVCRIIGYRIGLDENGSIVCEKIDDPEFYKLPIENKIQLAFTEWFLHQVSVYVETHGFEDEVKGLFAFAKGIDKLKIIIKEVASLKLFRERTIEETQAFAWFRDKMLQDVSEDDELLELKSIMVRQAIPVVINKALIRTYMFFDKFSTKVREKNVRSIEGLAFINPAYMSEEDKKRCDLLEGIAGMIFETMDLAGAGVSAAQAAAATGSGAAVLYAFATEVNFVNICNIVAICRRNKDEIIDAVKSRVTKDKYEKYVHIEEIKRAEREKLITDYLILNAQETKILYSLELQMIEEDIKATKDSETQVKKDKWKKEWMAASRKSTGLARLYYQDSDKLYSMINTRLANDRYNGWLHRIALEISLFVPYFPLNADESKHEKLKFSKNNYVDNVFCMKQNLITKSGFKELKETYKQYYNAVEHKQAKTTAGVVGAVAVAASTAVAAYVFAPVIAVALAGHLFTGLYGAALTNASLALFGGGAIAAGGFGMAGGTIVITGGGAILGMGISGGMTATALLLLSSSSYVQRDQAKLLTTCDFAMNHLSASKEDLMKIAENLDSNIKEIHVRLSVLKSAAAQDKNYKKESAELIKELEKSCKYLENSKALLEQMVS